MGNPHPTKSKPCKIGRKHTGALSLRAKGRVMSRVIQSRKIENTKFRIFKNKVKQYWGGELMEFPRINSEHSNEKMEFQLDPFL